MALSLSPLIQPQPRSPPCVPLPSHPNLPPLPTSSMLTFTATHSPVHFRPFPPLSASSPLLSTPFPATFTSPPQFLDLSANAFTGELPPSLFVAPRLCIFLVSRNNLSGDISIPFSSETEPSWAMVDISYNLLIGKLPAEFAAVGNVYVNNNQFTGAVPEKYIGSVNNRSITILCAQDNYLTEFAAAGLPALASLCLSYNCMVPPVAAIADCPSGSQAQLSRPPSQCVPSATATDRP